MAIVNINKQRYKANDQYLGGTLRLCYFSATEQNNNTPYLPIRLKKEQHTRENRSGNSSNNNWRE
jgi:hypothetical protein